MPSLIKISQKQTKIMGFVCLYICLSAKKAIGSTANIAASCHQYTSRIHQVIPLTIRFHLVIAAITHNN